MIITMNIRINIVLENVINNISLLYLINQSSTDIIEDYISYKKEIVF